MGWRRSLVDTGWVARFEVARAIRSWRAVGLVVVYVIANVGGAYLFIEALSALEDVIADQLAVPRTRWPGALLDEAREGEQLRQMLTALVRDEQVVTLLLDEPVLAVFQLWQGFVFVPFLVATAAAEAVSLDVASGAIRFEALRTGRAEIVAGRFLGQVGLAVVALGLALVAVWGLGMGLMVDQDPVAVASGLLRFGTRALWFALPFAALGIAASTLTTSAAWARVMALVATAGSWVLWGVVSWTDGGTLGPVTAALSPLLPQAWVTSLWQPTPDWFVGAGVCTALAAATVGLAQLRFQGRDL